MLFDVVGRTYRTIADVQVGEEGFCSWLPDSRRLLLLGGSGDVTVFDRESGSLKPAGYIGPEASNLSLSRDGRGLYGNKGGRPTSHLDAGFRHEALRGRPVEMARSGRSLLASPAE